MLTFHYIITSTIPGTCHQHKYHSNLCYILAHPELFYEFPGSSYLGGDRIDGTISRQDQKLKNSWIKMRHYKYCKEIGQTPDIPIVFVSFLCDCVVRQKKIEIQRKSNVARDALRRDALEQLYGDRPYHEIMAEFLIKCGTSSENNAKSEGFLQCFTGNCEGKAGNFLGYCWVTGKLRDYCRKLPGFLREQAESFRDYWD